MNYTDFLATKAKGWCGHAILDAALPSPLFDWQFAIVKWAMRKGRAAIFADCGLGKSFMQLVWAQTVPGRVLILAPLCVAEQTVAEGVKLDIPVTYARGQAGAEGQRIVITNYERLDRFDVSEFSGVVLDECFACGTLIDTPYGKKHIENIRKGDYILNCSGIDQVSDVHRREVQYAALVQIGNASVIASPNHPFFTQRGWVGAQHLRAGDYALATRAAMSLVRSHLHSEISKSIRTTILRNILFSEMADEAAEYSATGSYGRSRGAAWAQKSSMVRRWQSEGAERIAPDRSIESNEPAGCASEDIHSLESDEAQTFRAWGQWTRDDIRASRHDGCAWRRLDGGIQFVVGPTESWLSQSLQDRLRRSAQEARDRGGWQLAPCRDEEGRGRQKRSDATFARVDRVEILERGNPQLEQFRDANGKLYFYDLGATRHPSYSVNGCLVHNSSILKSFDGKTRTALIKAFARTPYRLCCTATPSPNDIAELANHAEFLGLQTRAEFLATWFVHDDSGWRMKRHAREPFFRWLASWAVAFRKPSDLGYSDEGFVLPPLTIKDYTIESETMPGVLFPELGAKGLGGRLAARRGSLSKRVDAVQNIVDERGDTWLVWCGLNEESDELARTLSGAVNLQGKDDYDKKIRAIIGFQRGTIKTLVTKLSIAGYGLNLQHCARMVFCGLSDSYESYYQGLRRCWRFGQKRPVEATIVVSEAERVIVDNVRRKEQAADAMATELLSAMRDFEREELAV